MVRLAGQTRALRAAGFCSQALQAALGASRSFWRLSSRASPYASFGASQGKRTKNIRRKHYF